jgi:hypothetical protein
VARPSLVGSPLGTVLYFSSEGELRALFESHFTILDLLTVEVRGTTTSHLASYSFMERKEVASK